MKYKRTIMAVSLSMMMVFSMAFVFSGDDSDATSTSVYDVDGLKNIIMDDAEIILDSDISFEMELNGTGSAITPFTIPDGKKIIINMNGHIISAIANPSKNGNYSIFDVRGELILKGTGTIHLEHKGKEMEWNNLSAVIQVCGGKLTVDGDVSLEHVGGTAMAYGIDMNSTLGETSVIINDGEVSSPYRAIRLFVNHTTAEMALDINDGFITGDSAGIWVQYSNSSDKNASLTEVTIDGGCVSSNNMAMYAWLQNNPNRHLTIDVNHPASLVNDSNIATIRYSADSLTNVSTNITPIMPMIKNDGMGGVISVNNVIMNTEEDLEKCGDISFEITPNDSIVTDSTDISDIPAGSDVVISDDIVLDEPLRLSEGSTLTISNTGSITGEIILNEESSIVVENDDSNPITLTIIDDSSNGVTLKNVTGSFTITKGSMKISGTIESGEVVLSGYNVLIGDVIVQAGATLIVDFFSIVDVPEEFTFTNDGMIYNNGTINGQIIGNGMVFSNVDDDEDDFIPTAPSTGSGDSGDGDDTTLYVACVAAAAVVAVLAILALTTNRN